MKLLKMLTHECVNLITAIDILTTKIVENYAFFKSVFVLKRFELVNLG